jgi:hypothetical protein
MVLNHSLKKLPTKIKNKFLPTESVNLISVIYAYEKSKILSTYFLIN